MSKEIKWYSPNYYNNNLKNLEKLDNLGKLDTIENFNIGDYDMFNTFQYLKIGETNLHTTNVREWNTSITYHKGAVVAFTYDPNNPQNTPLYIASDTSTGQNPNNTSKWVRLPSNKYKLASDLNNTLVAILPPNPNCLAGSGSWNKACFKNIDLYKIPYDNSAGPHASYVSPDANVESGNGCSWAGANGFTEISNNCMDTQRLVDAVNPPQRTPGSDGTIPDKPICTDSNCSNGCPNGGFRRYDNSYCLVSQGDSCLGMNATLKDCPNKEHVCGTDKGGGLFIFGTCFSKVESTCDLPAATPVCGGTRPPSRTTRPAGSGGGGDGDGDGDGDGGGGGGKKQWIEGIENNTVLIGGAVVFFVLIILLKSK